MSARRVGLSCAGSTHLPGGNVGKSQETHRSDDENAGAFGYRREDGADEAQVADVFEALESVIERHVQKGAVGACTIPGLVKIKVMKKPAQRARKNVPNPFRPGETMDVKAKPASTSVKVLPLKKLKDMA